ncbi:DAN domain family member 5 [Paramormyrops kingsleyae]|uniref:DAN domain family, member 5 n=1 Tax=Paramormyrops kingsleyae TaxID=1676925 RepID=A0A3B3S9B6_9TELE|nr:DAN domain family member 5-like [Paramormyrops kingsleyae]
MISVHFYFLITLSAVIHGFPQNAIEKFINKAKDLEASGSEADEPFRGIVKVVKISPHFLRPASLFRATNIRRGPKPRSPLPAFLALGRPGPVPSGKGTLLSALPKRHGDIIDVESKRRQGLAMWQRAMEKSSQGKEGLALPVNLKDISKQNCAAVPFLQRVTEAGCETVTVHNKLCFGQCSSLYIPPGGESAGAAPGGNQRASPCSRCSPSRSRYVTVPLRCRGTTRERQRRVMIVEECTCETGLEEGPAEGMAIPYLKH